MSARPWLARYPAGLPTSITPEFTTMLEVVRAAVATSPDAVALRYFDGTLTHAELDRRSDALAAAQSTGGFEPGDRLGLLLQNDPVFVIGLVAAWKAGGTGVLVNPMNKTRELGHILVDSGARALLTLDDLWTSVAREVVGSGDTQVRQVFLASGRDEQTRDDPRVLEPDDGRPSTDGRRVSDVIARHHGRAPAVAAPDPGSPAALTYTSGTTGLPKGVVNTHADLAFNSQVFRDWTGLTSTDVILGMAPLFHVTGLVGHVCTALLVRCPLVLAHRFHPGVVLDAIREHRPTFTVGAITAFNALAAAPGASRADFASVRVAFSGGAPVAPALRDRIREQTGMDVHNCFGLTETSSVTHAVPLGVPAPVDPTSGALSIGVPVFDTSARILDERGRELPPGEVGEIAISGPQVSPGYWGRPEQTAERFPGGELHTGDVGLMDAAGWFYVVDRKTDMINASGYKVWPREVEDVLLGHPAVQEAAVVGVPDEYRGENVKAVVSLRSGTTATADELIAFCRERMAAYTYPRTVELRDELPKTPTGKILRRALR